jgi:hypothetical protein
MNQPFTCTPNWFYDILPDLNGAETKLMNAVMRQTFGWHREEAQLTLEELQALSGIKSRTTVNRIVTSLKARGYLFVRAVGQDRYYRIPNVPAHILESRQARLAKDVQKMDTPCPKIEHPHVQKLDSFPPKGVQKLDSFDRTLKKKDLKKDLKKEEEESATAAPVHIAVEIYQDIFRRQPDTDERAYLENKLGAVNPDRWREICKLWVAKGWQAHMLSGMVDRYYRNAPARASPTHPPIASAPPPSVGIIELEVIDF